MHQFKTEQSKTILDMFGQFHFHEKVIFINKNDILLDPCALRLLEASWLVETFVSECFNFN